MQNLRNCCGRNKLKDLKGERANYLRRREAWNADFSDQVVQNYLAAVHNVHFGYYVFLPTEQAETYLKSCVLINYSTYICLCLFGWKENMINEETVSSKL